MDYKPHNFIPIKINKIIVLKTIFFLFFRVQWCDQQCKCIQGICQEKEVAQEEKKNHGKKNTEGVT